jgi:hypothetical protein
LFTILKILKNLKPIYTNKLFIIFWFIVLIYKSIFNSFSADFATKEIFTKIAQGQIELNVSQFSLLYGIVINDLIIHDVEPNIPPFIKSKRISVQYDLPALFLGKVNIPDISLDSTEVYLLKRNGKWNFENIFLSKNEEDSKEKEEVVGDSKPLTEINTYLPIKLFLNLFIHNLRIDVIIEDQNNPLEFSLDKFNFDFLLDTHRFQKVPLNLSSLTIIKTLKISINENNQIHIKYIDKLAKLNSDLNFNFLLEWLEKDNKKHFISKAYIGEKKIPLSIEGKNIDQLGIEFLYDIFYFLEEDSVEIKQISLVFSGTEWLDIRGKLKDITKEKPNIDIKVKESLINLSSLGNIVSSLPGLGPISLNGQISLAGIDLKGDIDLLYVTKKINANNLSIGFQNNKHEIPILNIDIDSVWNLSDKAISSENDILPILEKFSIHKFLLKYNGIIVDLSGEIIPKSKVDCILNIDNVVLKNFSKSIEGNVKLNSHIHGTKLSYLNLDTKLDLGDFRYFLGKSLSGKNNISLKFTKVLDFGSGFKIEDIQIDNLLISLKNENKEEAINTTGNLNIDFKKGLLFELIKMEMKIDFTYLIPTLPLVLKQTIAGLRNTFGRNIVLKGEIDYIKDIKNIQDIVIKVGAELPGIQLNDLIIDFDLKIFPDKQETIELDHIKLTAFNNKLKADYKGKFFKPGTPNTPFGEYTGELIGNFTLESEKYELVTKDIKFKGDIDFDLDINGSLIKAKLKSAHSFIKILSNQEGKIFEKLELFDIKMNVPISHDLHDLTMENLIEGNNESFLQNYGSTQGNNFSIEKIIIPHPSKSGEKFELIKPSNTKPGISGHIEYKENFLFLDNLRIFSLDGLIFIKDLVVNVGTGDPEKIHYNGIVQVRDIDLKQLLPEASQAKIDDGKIKADINVKGENLKDPIANIDLFFSIFQIGKDFGKSAVNIASPTNFITDTIINSYSVNKIEVEINHGLVYMRVLFDKSILNRVLFRLENDRIQQERIPLANFLKRAEDELAGYK